MEPFVGELVGRGLADAGVDVRVGVTVTGVHRPQETGPVTLTLEDGGELEADEVLFATGRQPLTDDIGLETLGLEPGSWLEIDETGLVRAVEDSWRCLLGVTFVGPAVEELIHSATVAVAGQVFRMICPSLAAEGMAAGAARPARLERFCSWVGPCPSPWPWEPRPTKCPYQ